MAQVIWTEPALADLDAIADYIALDNREAARGLVQKVFKQVEQLERRPKADPCLPSPVVLDQRCRRFRSVSRAIRLPPYPARSRFLPFRNGSIQVEELRSEHRVIARDLRQPPNVRAVD